jgi:hypothetical protein
MRNHPNAVSPATISAALLAWAVAAGALAFGGPQPLRGAVVLSFGLLGPGLALARRLPLPDLTARLALAPALSLAVGTLGAIFMVYTRTWSPSGLYLVLAALVAVASIGELARLRLQPVALAEPPQ